MTDIRLSRPEEIPAQKRLWKTAFGDDDAFIDWFYGCRGPAAQVLRFPEHPYTQELLRAVPRLDRAAARPEGQSDE